MNNAIKNTIVDTINNTIRIKICGLFRDEDIDYVNEAGPDFAGFVFAKSRRQVSADRAAGLRRRLAGGIVPVGVFVDAPPEHIIALYRAGVISIAQLHGSESGEYIARLKEASASGGGSEPIPVIKAVRSAELEKELSLSTEADYFLIDSGAGGGTTFDWGILGAKKINKPWFLAGGICIENIGEAMALDPFGIDISSGAETDGFKDRKKILQLTAMAGKGCVL